MRLDDPLYRDLVLVGGGHTHVLALRRLAMRPVRGVRITLISPDTYTPYSGMLPGLVAGHYRFEEAHIDLVHLCQWAGVRLVCARVEGVDTAAQHVLIPDRAPLEYDVLSVDIGALPDTASVPGADAFATPVKPVAGLWQRWQQMYQRIRQNAEDCPKIALVGGGAGSVELALAMARRLSGLEVEIALYCGATLLPGYHPKARALVEKALGERGVSVHLNARIVGVRAKELEVAGGRCEAFDELFWCTDAAAAAWIARSGLNTDGKGFMALRDTLQSVADERVFGAGDIATQLNYPRPKAGVFAVRQAPVLADNLRAALLGRRLRSHRPQKRFLSLLSLGDKRAVASRGRMRASGALMWWWKDAIDRRFMSRFSNPPRVMPRRFPARLPAVARKQQAPCGGCGAKIGADPLAETLAALRADYPGLTEASADDAAIVRVPDGGVLLQSVDSLRELVADPWLMGRIAALHAFSDLYACGATPLSALASITLPFASAGVLKRDLRAVLEGALVEFSRENCRLIGGHSMQGPEQVIGFTVNGYVAPGSDPLDKCGGRAGDKLVLTKPLGTGVLFAAHMQSKVSGGLVQVAVANMLVSNGPAASLAREHGVTAATDVSGFGLLGHLFEMLGDDLAGRLHTGQIPALAGVVDLLERGYRSTAHGANRAAAEDLVSRRAVDPARQNLLLDPQTSGGLLMALPAAQAEGFCSALRANGYPEAAVIGELVSANETTNRVDLF
ncbi:MAG: selenide, water dikinase SelD [Pseudomonadota bacterium]